MSTVFVIDPNTGEILEELIAHASYRSPKGVTVKPASWEEQQRIRAISEKAVKLREMREELEQLDRELGRYQECAGLMELEKIRRRRKAMAAELQQEENYAQTVRSVGRLRERMAELERVVLSVPSSGGAEDVEIGVDEYTGGAFSRLAARLDELSGALRSTEPALVERTSRGLVSLEEELETLPLRARKAFFHTQMRLELAQDAMDRLAQAGWTVSLETEGGADAPICCSMENAIGDRASAAFFADGQIRLETPGLTEDVRAALQQLVLGALRSSGAPATGRCMDHPAPAPERAAAQGEPLTEQADKERLV